MARASSSAALLLLICFFNSNLSYSLSVFMKNSEASQVLRIRKRANQFLEEIRPGDLERECNEEKCSFEEAREIFKSQEKTTEFWFAYGDSNPCKNNICKNGGICNVKHHKYSCSCPPKFGGNQCEIEKSECWYKNGGCSQYCQDTRQGLYVTCSCALGYALSDDGKSCTPSVRFPCGLLKKSLRSYQGRSAEGNQTDASDVALLNETMGQENVSSWNQSFHPAAWAGLNQTVLQGAIEQEILEEQGNFSEWDVPHLPSFNSSDEKGKIVGGSFCRPGSCPWQVLLQTNREYGFCGGSLISSRWVLTAAHCLDTVNPYQVTVGDFDKYKRERDEQKVRVQQYWRHPQYDSSNYNNDIALIQLTSDVAFTTHVLPICLPSPDLATLLMEGKEPGMVSGWGSTHSKGSLSRFLLNVRLPIVSMDTCRQSTEKLITGNMFCAGYAEEAQDSCKGDSGGPFAVPYQGTWYLLGIVSWGEGCAESGKYGAYTRVANYISWIKEVTESATDESGFLHTLQ
ncbi:coagulation factor X-like isoform X2 [Varanus komodoensis]|nr:coagulation factor X-like isoform X2 [Varanus komodoensis]XP_044291433.1 coagulation factor X-like isoform X2 [Varanus komodoensis]